MNILQPPSVLEKLSASPATELALTAAAAFAGGTLAALLPPLAKIPAALRQAQRVQQAFEDITRMLEHHGDQLQQISDEQYKIINELALALHHTTSNEKIAWLKNAVQNTLYGFGTYTDQEAAFLSRTIRDMSADEAAFLVANFKHDRVWMNKTVFNDKDSKISVLSVAPESREGQIFQGLVTLGLAVTAEPTWDETGLHRFTPYAAKVLALLRQPSAD